MKNKKIIIILIIAVLIITAGAILFYLKKGNKQDNTEVSEVMQENSTVKPKLEITQETTEELPEMNVLQLEKIEKETDESSDGDADSKDSDSEDADSEAGDSAGDEEEESELTAEEMAEKEKEEAELASVTNARLAEEMSEDLFSGQLIFDGRLLTVPFNYSEICDKYSFDPADYGYKDGIELESGQRVVGTVELESEEMDDNVTFWAGFINDTDKPLDIMDSKVNAIRLDIRWSNTEDYPTLILPGSISWGSTLEDIYAAYGEPEKEPAYMEDSGYTSLSYDSGDYRYYVELIVYDEIGLTEVSIRCY